ncbi:MAG: GGDEF domain-containing protein [Eubacteriales bacterium]|nr:GGDEF domain-containing protein [Eubacteriales bacterium]
MAVILTVLALARGSRLESIEGKPQSGEFAVLNGSWEQVPAVNASETRFRYLIPEEYGKNLMFSFECYWCSIRIFLDEEEIYFYEDPWREKGINRQWLEIPEDAAGKTLTLVFLSPSTEDMIRSTMDASMYLGDRNAVFYRFLSDNLYAAIFGLTALIMSIVILMGSFYFRKGLLNEAIRGFLDLGMFILFAGAWIVTDSQILQMFTGNTGMISLVSFLTFMIMPYFLVSFIQEMFIHKSKALGILQMIYPVSTAVYALFFILRIYSIQFLPVQHLLIAATAVILMKNCVSEMRRFKSREMVKIVQGLGLLLGSALISLILFYRNPSSAYPYFYSIGMILFMFCLVDAAYCKGYYYMGKSASIEAYKELAYMDAMTGMGNRTAFMRYQENASADRKAGYIMMDINNLKLVNDNYGHKEGDRLIIDAAECIRESFQRIGKCFRIGGDEFVVIVEGLTEKEIMEELARMDEAVSRKNHNREIPIRIARGISVWQEGMNAQTLMEKADMQMYRNKTEMKREQQYDRNKNSNAAGGGNADEPAR